MELDSFPPPFNPSYSPEADIYVQWQERHGINTSGSPQTCQNPNYCGVIIIFIVLTADGVIKASVRRAGEAIASIRSQASGLKNKRVCIISFEKVKQAADNAVEHVKKLDEEHLGFKPELFKSFSMKAFQKTKEDKVKEETVFKILKEPKSMCSDTTNIENNHNLCERMKFFASRTLKEMTGSLKLCTISLPKRKKKE